MNPTVLCYNLQPERLGRIRVLALRLGIREAARLLRSAGYAFSEASDFDLICSYFIEEGEWDPAEVNDALWAYGQPLVCGAVLD